MSIDESGFAHDCRAHVGMCLLASDVTSCLIGTQEVCINVIGALIGEYLLMVGLLKSNIDADTFFG